MQKLTKLSCAVAIACAASFLGGCGDSGMKSGTVLVYRTDALDPAAADTSNQTMKQAEEKEDPQLQEYVAKYNASHAARPVAVAQSAPKPAAPKLDPPLASQADIDAAKARIDELNGSYTLAKNGAIVGIHVESPATTVDDMKLFGKLADLTNFFFQGANFNDEMLVELKDLQKVDTAQIQNADITVETLNMLKAYPELKTLDIRRDLKIENADLAVIPEFPKLERLNAYYNSFSNSGVNKISKSTTLKIVDLRGCEDIADSAAKYLARMSTLEEVYFRFGISNAGVDNLKAAPNLKFVEFQDCLIDNACATAFADYPALTGLRFFRSKSFTDEGIKALGNLKLERLELRDLSASDDGVAGLKNMSTLRNVEISELAVTDGVLNELCGSEAWSQMETLNFFSVPVTDETVKIIASNMKGLKNLRIRASGGKNTDATIDEIVKIDSLVTLDLRENGGISPEAFMKLAGMKNLRKVYVKDTKFGASDEAAVKMREEFKKLNPKCSISNEG